MYLGASDCVVLMLSYRTLLSQVEDIVDTGNTLSCVISHMQSKGALSVSVCAFLDKPSRRKSHFEPVGEGKFYRGFEVRIIHTHTHIHTI